MTTSVGSFAASELLTFSDADIGAASSGANDLQMTLNLVGAVDAPVVPPTTAVPEPATLALLGLGLVGLVASRRRSQ